MITLILAYYVLTTLDTARRRRPSDPFDPPEKFHARATQEIGRWKDCIAKSGEAACLKRYEPQQLIKGMYAGFVEVSVCAFKLP